MNKVLWLATTADDLELPVAVADTAEELAGMLKVTRGTIMKSRWRMNHGAKSKYYKVFKIEYKESVEDEQI